MKKYAFPLLILIYVVFIFVALTYPVTNNIFYE